MKNGYEVPTMKQLFRLLHDYHVYFAVREGDQYRLLKGDPEEGEGDSSLRSLPVAGAVLLPPTTPTKIIAIGLNYHSHAQELGMKTPTEPILFLKPLTALSAPGAPILLPRSSRQVEYEGELAIVIGKLGHHIPEARALEWIQGYTLANDVTARDLQNKDGQWTRAKGFDGFCPLGPSVVSGLDPQHLEFTTRVNGKIKQIGKVSDMIFSIPKVVAFVSEVMTLFPGDVILTGTPPGVGLLRQGDTVSIESEAIGVLENKAAAEE
jgi:2-keto-4-pentenoate hydratase/2-oxohepta-3-ene-1,7-dioic acid hydratase in catechol pathway